MEIAHNTEAIAIVVGIALVASMMGAFIVGRFAGLRQRRVDPVGAVHVTGTAVEASIYALLGLLIAFTFSHAADRFDMRRSLIADEANAVLAAYRAADFLEAADRDLLRERIREYTDARINFYSVLPNFERAQAATKHARGLEAEIWRDTMAAMPHALPGSISAITIALTRMFDVAEERYLMLLAHPPAAIYGLLIALALVCAALAGHHSSAGERHPWILPLTFAGTLGIAIFVILDLEYPRAGLIRIDAADVLLEDARAEMD
jgi:hypothetical protein